MILDLRENHRIFCSAVAYPVIPKGEVMIRIIPTAAHSLEDVEYTVNAFKEIKRKLEAGIYASKRSPRWR
jgi:glycine C-acetyltransferase